MPRLDARLKCVASMIRSERHADIGSDHGHLLAALLAAGRIEFGFAIENKRQPFENSKATLNGYAAEVRFADGLAGLRPAEVDSLSICGMGGGSIVRILEAFPERVPDRLMLQPNKSINVVRRWARNNRFKLLDERCTQGGRRFEILSFQRTDQAEDPAYQQLQQRGCDSELGYEFGPWFLLRQDAELRRLLREELDYLKKMPALTDESRTRMEAISRLEAAGYFFSR
ncbi:class I SAM-dependent methyltransferase [Rhodopirellula halodulae]|nr:class I SAM-dependent methyltransferase [Rhodopirellula sp. JC740]